MEKRRRIPRSALEPLVRAGLSNDEIERSLGVNKGRLRLRVRNIRQNIRDADRKAREQEAVVCYSLSAEEISRRYGRPGEHATAQDKTVADYYRIAKSQKGRTYET